jgi:hypothetical protein
MRADGFGGLAPGSRLEQPPQSPGIEM